MDIRDIDLRKYLQLNNNKLNWKQKINITFEIIRALYVIHKENSIHKNLHSGNILYSQLNNQWYISDLGFSGPANKPSSCIYGNLPYIAPEVIKEKDYTFKSDIYSIGILMWEISSGHPPYINYGYNYNLAINIINGIRPKVTLKIPVEYKNLMEQCWDANPLKRPDLFTLMKKIREMNSYYQGITDDSVKTEMYDNLKLNKTSNSISSKLFTSKIYQFENLPEPRNATEVFYSKLHDYNNKDNNKNNKSISKIFKAKNKKFTKMLKKLQKKNDVNNDDKNQSKPQTKGSDFDDDDDEVYHSERQDGSDSLDGKFYFYFM
ncbi:kinase-like domain-containing protein [Rhizophagus diaphanus]|nr:kinase-like domain-containing protein [Rhizophagus diaphanus] [Rhizophagus sp. MUCL 43196]